MKNSGFLYIRMGINVFISLYTTRIVLDSLGASDFGIFNIVGGAIAMMGFLSSTLVNATQRFTSYALGAGDLEESKKMFNISIVLNLLYAYNPDAAVAELVADGWVYDEKGNDYVEGIRYKKVTAEEAGTYVHNVTLEDGTILMPLIIEWSSSQGNSVSDLLSVMLANGEQTAAAGMKINQNVMTFSELLNYMYRDASQGDKYGVPTYGMFNLASNWSSPVYDRYDDYTTDPKKLADGYNTNFLVVPELDQLTYDMVYGVEAGDSEGYLNYWKQFIKLWNELLPEVPLYSNIYVTVYPDWLENYEQTSYWSFENAIVYANIAE